jgi:two-component sensor histidine kinase
MSLIHKKLYQPDSEGAINMAQYIGDLALHLSEALSPDSHIELETRVAPVELSVAQAVPIGLILNEAITNAYKYAFKDLQPGSNDTIRSRIAISLQTIGEAGLELGIKDNGKGYFPVPPQGKHTSLGFVLIEMLTRQLRGTLSMLNEDGLIIRIRFPAQYRYLPE